MMLLLMTAALLGTTVFGGLGIWADDLLLTLVIAPFGGCLFAALAALLHIIRHPNDVR